MAMGGNVQPSKVTERIYAIIFELLEHHPRGLRWSELLKKIKAADPSLHPKTVNGCVWKLVERFPDKIYKPSKGLFRLRKYEAATKSKGPSARRVVKQAVKRHPIL